jgi:hypothetical protein
MKIRVKTDVASFTLARNCSMILGRLTEQLFMRLFWNEKDSCSR